MLVLMEQLPCGFWTPFSSLLLPLFVGVYRDFSSAPCASIFYRYTLTHTHKSKHKHLCMSMFISV